MKAKSSRFRQAALALIWSLVFLSIQIATCQNAVAAEGDIKLECDSIDVKKLKHVDIIYISDVSPAQDYRLYYSMDSRKVYLDGLDDGCHLEVHSQKGLQQVRKEEISNDERYLGSRLVPAAEAYFDERVELCDLDPRTFADNRPNPALTTPEAKKKFLKNVAGSDRTICDLLISSRSVKIYLRGPDKKIAIEVVDGRVFAKEFK